MLRRFEELRDSQKGQSLVLITFAFMGLLAFVGLGVDLGLFYVERVQIGRAVDAAALAAVSELPVEQAARERALTYLQDNDYDHTSSGTVWRANSYVNTADGGSYTWDPGLPPTVTTVIWVDTAYSYDTFAADPSLTASKIRVRVRQKVPTIFMQFFGFKHLPVEGLAEAENIDHVDSVIVYDDSASMEFNTVCYGCWERNPDELYPKGYIYPLHWSDTTTATADHCVSACGIQDEDYTDYESDTDYEHNDCHYRYDQGSEVDYYTVIEAEEYSRISPEYQPVAGQRFHTFWVIQHNDKGAYYHKEDRSDRGAYLRHHPYASLISHFDGIAVPCTWDDLNDGRFCAREVPDAASHHLIPGLEEEIESIFPQPIPQADYHFQVPTTTTYYFWARGQGGDDGSDHIFWGLDGAPPAQESEGKEVFGSGAFADGARSGSWDWRCLGSETLSQDLSTEAHTLNIWAGAPGFALDRILITTDDSNCDSDGTPPAPSGFRPNKGRTDWACEPCDPRFAGRPPDPDNPQVSPPYRPECAIDNRYDPIYDDEQPIRDALESAKYFVSRMDIRLDQIGYVSYDSGANIEDELRCVRHLGPENVVGNPSCDPSYDPYDPDCGCRQKVITNTVLSHLDQARASGGTNIAQAIRKGVDVLRTSDPHHGRPGAAHIMILMTDGQANGRSGTESACEDPDLYPNDDDLDNDCAVYYAQKARDNGVAIYTIGLGSGHDKDLLRYIADLTGGDYYPATRDNLDGIFDKLYERIFIRLVK